MRYHMAWMNGTNILLELHDNRYGSGGLLLCSSYAQPSLSILLAVNMVLTIEGTHDLLVKLITRLPCAEMCEESRE